MRAAVYYGRKDIRFEEVPERSPGAGEVKLRVLYNGICGSDVHEYFAGPLYSRTTPHPLSGVQNPVILGHELSGEIVELGPGVDDLAIGDLIAVEPVEPCGRCRNCSAGRYNHCRTGAAMHGYTRDGGGLSQFTVIKRSMAHKLPPGVSGMLGALAEPLAVAYHAVRRARVRPGDLVAIHGAGPIGIGALLTLRREGVRVAISDPSPERRAIALRLGADHSLDPVSTDIVAALRDLTDGDGAAASIDASGAPPIFPAALASTAIDGTIVQVGNHMRPLEIPPFALHMAEVFVTGSAIYCDEFPAVLAAMASGAYPIDEWVTTIPFDGLIDQGIEKLHRQEGIKILVDVAGGI